MVEDEPWGYDVTLDSIKAAGFRWTGLLTSDEPFISAKATPEYLAVTKAKIAARSLQNVEGGRF